MDNLIAAGKAKPMLVVMDNLNAAKPGTVYSAAPLVLTVSNPPGPLQKYRWEIIGAVILLILIGLLIGIPISIGCARLIAAQLYHVKGWDPLVLSGSILALGVCALIASIIPARRAASINPVKALRTE